MRILGLMSGTSMDGVDAALIETDGERLGAFGQVRFQAYSDEDRGLLRQALVEAADLDQRRARPPTLRAAEALVTRRHADAVRHLLSQSKLRPSDVDLIGFHGQTVVHRPERRLTVQIGDGVALAQSLGVPVVYDFRAADVEAGGQGAPLAPVYHRALVEKARLALPAVLLNLGGVGNVTFIGEDGELLACDTGPGNALIDDLMLERLGVPLDRDGATASAGVADEAIVARLLDHPYFSAPPPKSLDRNEFSRAPVAGLATADAAATLTAFTAASVAAVLKFLPATPRILIVTGGGAHNPALMRALAERTGLSVARAEDFGWSSDAIEAQAFAFLAARAFRNLPLTFPGTTGVAAPLSGGRLASP